MATTKRKNQLRRNISIFYLYRIFSSLSFVAPIFVLFFQDNGLSITQIMILQSIYTAVMMLVSIPAGVLADRIGRKKMLIISAVLLTFAWSVFAASHTFLFFLIAEISIALSTACWLSAGTAFFYDNLYELKQNHDFKKLFGRMMTVNYLSWGTSALVGSYIAISNLRLPFIITALVSSLAVIALSTLTEPKPTSKKQTTYTLHIKTALRCIKAHPSMRTLIAYSSLTAALGFVTFILYQPYLKSIGIPLVAFGLVYFLMGILAAGGSSSAHLLERWYGERKSILLLASLLPFTFAGMAAGIPWLGAIFPIAIFFITGLIDPITTDAINKNIDTKHRATVLSTQSMLTDIIATCIAPLFGFLVDSYTISLAFVVAAGISGVSVVVLYRNLGKLA